MRTLITRWREDQGGTYRAWFLWDERLKNFRSIRRGIMTVVQVRAQLHRPAFQRVGDLHVRFLPYSELERHREAMERFGQGLKAFEAVARDLA